MLNIAVIEDTDSDYQCLIGELKSVLEERQTAFEMTRFKDGTSFIQSTKERSFDLAFIDIQLENDENGFETSKTLREYDRDVMIVFVTNLMAYAVNGYEVDATDYILKPITHDEFSKKMDRILQHLSTKKQKTLFLKTSTVSVYLRTDEISYVEVLKHYLIYHASERTVKVRGTMDESVKELSPYGFSRCNKSFLVNMNKVVSVEDNLVYLKDEKDPVVIGRTFRNTFLNNLAKYLT